MLGVRPPELHLAGGKRKQLGTGDNPGDREFYVHDRGKIALIAGYRPYLEQKVVLCQHDSPGIILLWRSETAT